MSEDQHIDPSRYGKKSAEERAKEAKEERERLGLTGEKKNIRAIRNKP